MRVDLRLNRFNMDLLVYLRYVLRFEFFKLKAQFIKVTSLMDLKFEVHCLRFYMNLMTVLFKQAEAKTTLESDLALL